MAVSAHGATVWLVVWNHALLLSWTLAWGVFSLTGNLTYAAYTAFIDGVRIDWFRSGLLCYLNAYARSAATCALGFSLR